MPSAADRWLTCTASPQFIFDNWDRLPVEDRMFADPGNTAHEVAAAFLQNRKVDPKNCPVPVDAQMNWNGWNYMEFVEGLVAPGGKLFVEQRLPLFYNQKRNAVVDVAIVNPDHMHIVDYKYGEGIIVSPENNNQGIIYARCVTWNRLGHPHAFDKPDDFPIFVTIYQPRTRDDKLFHTWETTWGEIKQKANDIAYIANGIYLAHHAGETLEFKPSEKACQWCPAKGFCEARQRELVKDLEMLAVIDGTAKPVARVLTEKQLAAIVRHGDEIKRWIDDAQAFALQLMRSGGKIPGFKLVLSRGGNRHWTDPAKAAKYLLEDTILREDEIYTQPKPVSPKQIEDLLGKGKIPARAFKLIGKSPPQPVIAPEDDPRESALIDGAKEFVDLDLDQVSATNLDDY